MVVSLFSLLLPELLILLTPTMNETGKQALFDDPKETSPCKVERLETSSGMLALTVGVDTGMMCRNDEVSLLMGNSRRCRRRSQIEKFATGNAKMLIAQGGIRVA